MHAGEGVGDREHQAEEKRCYRVADDLGPDHQRFIAPGAEAEPHSRQVAGKDERPQQDGTGQVRPHGRNAVDKWGERAVVVIDVGKAEVVGYERSLHRHSGEHGAGHDKPDVDLASAHQRGAPAGDSDNKGHAAGERAEQPQQQAALAQGDVHERCDLDAPTEAVPPAGCASTYLEPCWTIIWKLENTSPCQCPSSTTGIPTRNS